jgi:hypothetical protein
MKSGILFKAARSMLGKGRGVKKKTGGVHTKTVTVKNAGMTKK